MFSFDSGLWPHLPLAKGDLVALCSVSGPPDLDLLSAGAAVLHDMGLRVQPCLPSSPLLYLAGQDDERAGAMNVCLADPQIKGIFLARGGYGSMRILDDLDVRRLRRRPKLIFGMSDVTALQLSLFKRIGLVSMAGPMPAGQIACGLDALSARSLEQAVFGSFRGVNLIPEGHGVRILRRGVAHGPLLGGCLSLITALMGTPHVPDMTGACLLIEDVSEPLYRIDRMLMQLKLGGVLDAVSAVVAGHFLAPNGDDISLAVDELLMTFTRDIPLLAGFPHGHALPNVTLPHGSMVQLDTGGPRLTVDAKRM